MTEDDKKLVGELLVHAGSEEALGDFALAERLRLAAAREEGRQKWQTIDTAPRDQRIIVGRAAVRAGTATLPAFCGEAFWSESKQAWCFNSEFFGHPVMEYDNPTHWMPTPTPPGDDK